MSRQSFFPVGDPSPTRLPFKSVLLSSWATDEEGGEAGGAKHPFQVIDIGTSAFPRRVEVVPGVLNAIVPQINAVSGGFGSLQDMDNIPRPTVDLPVNSELRLYMRVDTTASGVASAVALAFVTSTPTGDVGPTRGYQLVATVFTESTITSIIPYIRTNLGHRRCKIQDHVFWSLG
jgi:hypothetical protein